MTNYSLRVAVNARSPDTFSLKVSTDPCAGSESSLSQKFSGMPTAAAIFCTSSSQRRRLQSLLKCSNFFGSVRMSKSLLN